MKRFDNFDKVNEEAMPIKTGHFIVKDNFTIDPGGAWRISFRKDEILRIRPVDILERYNKTRQEWRNVSPPVEGADNFNLDQFADSRKMYFKFIENTVAIPERKALELIGKVDLEFVNSLIKQLDEFKESPLSNQKINNKISLLIGDLLNLLQ